ncbi:hypothetical protein TNCT_164671 [Trichonephila clavata]|uniref:Uncharacterized protein n=1 Tax=Trichonephila clavata TaxID=2740835 RepID=A0A8X6FHW6_TRICU|nr:hypothetical protein TNCT_164671 [Trichonephila clavata]
MVAEDGWVSQIIPLLLMEIAEIVAKEPPEKGDDYPHIKNLLLARFQLTPVALRDKFESYQRRPDTWDNFKEAKGLAQKLDHFDAIKRVHKKPGLAKTWERRTYDKPTLESKNKFANFSGSRHVGSSNRILLSVK